MSPELDTGNQGNVNVEISESKENDLNIVHPRISETVRKKLHRIGEIYLNAVDIVKDDSEDLPFAQKYKEAEMSSLDLDNLDDRIALKQCINRVVARLSHNGDILRRLQTEHSNPGNLFKACVYYGYYSYQFTLEEFNERVAEIDFSGVQMSEPTAGLPEFLIPEEVDDAMSRQTGEPRKWGYFLADPYQSRAPRFVAIIRDSKQEIQPGLRRSAEEEATRSHEYQHVLAYFVSEGVIDFLKLAFIQGDLDGYPQLFLNEALSRIIERKSSGITSYPWHKRNNFSEEDALLFNSTFDYYDVMVRLGEKVGVSNEEIIGMLLTTKGKDIKSYINSFKTRLRMLIPPKSMSKIQLIHELDELKNDNDSKNNIIDSIKLRYL